MARVPLSENVAKQTNASKETCLIELRKLAEAEPDRVITRNYFRVNGPLAESDWNRYFGTWAEFKRAAGITLSRHAQQLERHIAKHVAADATRTLSTTRQGREGTYSRPSSKRWQTAAVISDTHGLHCDGFVRRVFMDTLARVQPEIVVLNGDMLDLPEFSRFTRDPRTFDVLGEIRWLHAFLRDVREAAPDAEIRYTEGNHEHRLLRHLAEATPALQTILSDLHGWTVPTLLGLDQFQVNYIAKGDLAAFQVRDSKQQLKKHYTILHDCYLVGHYPELMAMGLPGTNGHHHVHKATPFYSARFGPSTWMQTGCGHRRDASYCLGEKWSQGFLLAHIDTQSQRTQQEYVELSHPGAMVGGRFYERTTDEPVSDLNGVRL